MTPKISKEEVIEKHFWLWPLFCLQAGLINTGGFLACHRFVTHVTGFGTRIGVEFVQGKILLGIEMLLIPVGFILGCMTAGYFTEVRRVSVTLPLITLSLLLGLISLGGDLALFGVFGEPLVRQRDFALLTLLCFSAGLQNATLASITGGAVRTTHMTGVATDLGLNVTRLLFKKDVVDLKWFRLRMMKLTFFGLGGAIGTLLFSELEYLGFLVPALINLALLLKLRAGVV